LLKKPNRKIADLKTKTLRVKINLREVKRRAKDDDTPNNSMDVRAKQRLSYRVVRLTRSCVAAVSPHVISAVSRFLKMFMKQK